MMTNDELRKIHERADTLRDTPFFKQSARMAKAQQQEDVPALLAYIDRLRDLVGDIASYPEHQDEDLWLAVLRQKARAALADEGEVHQP